MHPTMEITTPLSIPSNLGSTLLSHGRAIDLVPTFPKLIKIDNNNSNNNNNFTSARSEFVYSIHDYNNFSMSKVTSSSSSSLWDKLTTTTTSTTTTTTTTTAAYRRRRGPYRRPRRPQLPHEDFLNAMDKYVMPAAYTIGILGSLILIPVFTCTPLKASALSHYLTAIGVADVLYLLSCLAVWISRQGYRFNNVIGVCQLTMFTLRLSRFMATWYLFAAHVERCLVHFGSPRARVWCSTFRTKCIILGFFVFSLVGFLHYIWTHVVVEDYGKHLCIVMADSIKHILRLNWIELVASVFLPMALVMPMDVALLISLISRRYRAFSFRGIKSNNNNSSSMRSNSSSSGGGGGGGLGVGGGGGCGSQLEDRMDGYVLARRRRSRTLSTRSGDSTPPPPEFDLTRERSCATLVVVISGLLFVALLLPSSIYRAKVYFQKGFIPTPEDLSTMTFGEQLDKFNHVFKCFLYIVLLRGFRHGLAYLRRCHRKRIICENSLQETEV